MSKIDITESELYISKLSQTYRGFLPRRVIPMRVEGRALDGLILILAGQCHYLFDDGTAFTAAEGDILYLAKDAKYAMNVDCERYEFFVVNFFFADQDTRQSAILRPATAWESSSCFPVFAPAVTSPRSPNRFRCSTAFSPPPWRASNPII